MKNSLYQSLLNRLKNKHAKLSTRFHNSVKEGDFQKQRYRKRKESVERIKSLEKRIHRLGNESGFKVALNYKHWAVALAMGVVVSAGAQEKQRPKLADRALNKNLSQMMGDLPLAQTVFFDNPVSIGHPYLAEFHTGDIDGDGDIDAIYVSYIDNPLILFNQGGFTFTQGEIPINSTGIIENTRLADFDGDGDLDLFAQDGPYGASTSSIWLNDGLGNFSELAAVFPAVDTDEDRIQLADLDGDGDLDMVGTTSQASSPYYNFVTTFNNIASDFSDTTAYQGSYVFSKSSRFVALMDADGDSDIDILYTSYVPSNGNSLQVLTNDGAGNFTDSGQYLSLTDYIDNDIDTLDIDNDGDTDFIASISTYPNVTVRPFLNDGSGNFTEGTQFVIPQNQDSEGFFTIDENGDDFDDIIVNTQADSSFVYRGDGAGGFSQLAKFLGESKPEDIDGDADADLFFFDGDISIQDNQGAGTFVQGADFLNVSVSYDTDLVDIDGDGDLDLVQGSQVQSRVWLNDGLGNFSFNQDIGRQGFSQIFGDLDGDSDPDMIRAIEQGTYPGLDIWTNAGGLLSFDQNIGSGSIEFRIVELDTLDADADLDIIAYVDNGTNRYLRNYSNDGGLTFSQMTNIQLFYDVSQIDKGDVDGDFDIDLIVSYEQVVYGVKTFLNDGSGNFSGGLTFNPTVATGLTDVDLFDADGDGDLDAFVTSETNHQLWLNNGSGAFTYGSQINSPAYVYRSYIGDIDSDGDIDIMLGGYLTYPQLWVNDGLGNFVFDSDIPAIADEYAKLILGDLDNDGDQDIAFGGYYVGTKIFINQALVPGPEINVQGGGNDIASGDITPDLLDGTDFGTFILGDTPPTVQFTIQNTGTTDLNISAISLNGTNATDFAITNITTPTAVSAGTDVTFDLTFNPATDGSKIASIEITSDDADEPTYTFDIAGNALTAQEINVQGNGIDILTGDATPDAADGTDFGNVIVGTPLVQSFTIQNTGQNDLSLSLITVTGANAADFVVSNITLPSIVSGVTDVSFDLTYTPSSTGPGTATVQITNDDADEAVYTFDVAGTGQTEQEINVQGNGLDILSGDITPDPTDGTDFGTFILGDTPPTVQFTIQNTGTIDLNVSTISLNGTNATDFAITNVTTPATVSGGTDITFDLTFNPATDGSKIASIEIVSDDADEPTYTFDIAGIALTPQEINVQGNGIDILTGDATPDAADGTDFGTTTVGLPVVQTFTIQNTGQNDLSLTLISVTGTNAADFVVSNITLPSIVPGITDVSFDLIYTPTASGASAATVQITNDDADEATYTFDVAGIGLSEQEINVQGNGLDILSGDVTPTTADGTDFGTVTIGTTSTSTFTIQNTGESDLNITSVGTLGGDVAQFSITNVSTPVTVAGGANLTFDVNYTPLVEATHLLNIGILSDDTDESLYSFDVTGVAITDPLLVDSLALVDFYNNNDGINWTDNTNWLVANQPLGTWAGISLTSTSDRIEIVELPNNGLSGTLSNDLNSLDALTTLDLSGNDIDALATDFSGLTSATTINLDGNQLDFGDLEAVAGVGALTYDNQQEINAINETGPILIPVGSDQVLTTTVNGTSNTYQWVLDGTDLTGETNDNITITSIDRSNMGSYSLKVSNSIATGVTLTTPPIDVLATAVISVDAQDVGTSTTITENVNAYLFQINTGTASDTLDAATQLDVAGAFDFPPVVLGDFLVAVESTIPLTDVDGNPNDQANYIPTYFGDAFDSKDATTLELNNDVQLTIIMTPVPAELTSVDGQGVVSGTIEDDFGADGGRIDARRRAAGRKCGLKKRRSGGRTGQEDIYDLIAYGETNENGEFEYGFLPEGTYRFFVEYPGIPLDESAFVQFDIGEAGVADDTFVLAVFASEEGIQIELILGITSDFFTDFNIYPNPTTDLLTIQYGESKGDISMEIVNMEGKSVMSRSIRKDESSVQIDTSIFPAGQYLIKFIDQNHRSNTLVYRLIKK